ncbi:MAG: hypothetical protein ACJ759_13115 [Thermoanaerobaculia bacterium]
MTMFEEAISQIEGAYSDLGHSLGWRFLYSPISTLSASTRLLLVGLNPAGREHHICRSVEKGNAYRLEKWGKEESLNALQVQIGHLFEILARKVGQAPDGLMDSTLTSNFCPFRSPSWEELHEKTKSIEFSRKLWSWLLPELSPSAIICLGSDPFIHFREVLLSLGGVEHQHRRERSEWGNVTYGESHIKLQSRDVLLLRLPHLSTYKIFTRPECAATVESFTDRIAEAMLATFGHRGQIALELDQETLQKFRG